MKPLHDPVDVTGNGGPSRTIRQIWQRLSKLKRLFVFHYIQLKIYLFAYETLNIKHLYHN